MLGIAERTISVKNAQNRKNGTRSKPLPESVKTIGDRIKTHRQHKNLTPGHVAMKMGIATALVLSWESGISNPDNQQLKGLVKILGYDGRSEPAMVF